MTDRQGRREVSIFKWVNQLSLLQFNLWACTQIFHLLKTNLVFILRRFLLLFLPEMKHDAADIFMVFLFCFQSWNHSIVPSRCSHINRAIELWQNRVIQHYLFVKIGLKKIVVFVRVPCCISQSFLWSNHFCSGKYEDLWRPTNEFKGKTLCSQVLLPPRVAEMRRCVPYFLMMVSMNCWVVGLRPSKRTLRWNSGMSGTGFRIRSLLSIAVFLTFQRANSLLRTQDQAGMCEQG